LLDISVAYKYSGLDKTTKYQEGVFKSYNSKVLLQETILEKVNFYKQLGEIYFPARLDQRGRLYCTPNHFNYQSNELSKALILFSKPGYIKRNDLDAVSYLKSYGANCYGGLISKCSVNAKQDWVNRNVNDIINYENGILLHKAKDKLLFLAFCMKFKRYHDFYVNESLMEFESYLTIQLDATCNGFQHMALLSNERTLFKELNLVKLDQDKPKDFYNFLLFRIVKICKLKVDSGDLIDKISKGSYERLLKFVWERSFIKKAVMTLPYNARHMSMQKYIRGQFEDCGCDKENKLYCYTDNSKKLYINNNDIPLLTILLRNVVFVDFEKIKKLSRYIVNVAKLLNILELPISWNLPSGLKVTQSYMQVHTTSITPFNYSKIKLNF